MTSPWLIHIGYRKCGSTWMQRRLYPLMSGVEFLGKRYERTSHWTNTVRDLILKGHCFDFCADEVREVIETHAGPATGKTRILSYEGFTGELWQASIDSQRNADRIKQTFPGAKILIIVRRQVEHIESIYKQYILTGGVLSVQDFLKSDCHHLRFSLDSLRYDRLAEYYIKLFGQERVLVLPFELMCSDIQGFSDAVCDFLEVPHVMLDAEAKKYVRSGLSARHCEFVRRLNTLRKSTFVPWGVIPRGTSASTSKLGLLNPFRLGEKILDRIVEASGAGELFNTDEKQKIREYFRVGNKKLETLFPGLAPYGYEAGKFQAA